MNLEITERLQGFQGCLQNQYNSCPVGQYAGPYDQNQSLHLNVQLPESDLNFEKYASFSHPNTMKIVMTL